jgi:N6-L-threonylcarbamoyladenine synthase
MNMAERLRFTMKANYTILAIETSLDDTCAAVIQDGRLLSNVIASQVAFHADWGGTVPHIAKRKHIEWIDKVVAEALKRARIIPAARGIDAVAVTQGPGLAPCLEVGISKARALASLWQIPLIAVNHLEGHLLSSFAKNSKGNYGIPSPVLPALGFIISGGHTELVLMHEIGTYTLLGQTLDDAAGEAYDKVARMLNLGYPGGPILSDLAKEGKPIYQLPEPMRDRKDLRFSFSGLKTAAKNKLKELRVMDPGSDSGMAPTREFIADFAASFEKAVLLMLQRRLRRAIELHQPQMVLLGGGVVSNLAIRRMARQVASRYKLRSYTPYSSRLFTDNAGMIGLVAWHKAKRGEFVEDLDLLDRKPNFNFSPALDKSGSTGLAQ